MRSSLLLTSLVLVVVAVGIVGPTPREPSTTPCSLRTGVMSRLPCDEYSSLPEIGAPRETKREERLVRSADDCLAISSPAEAAAEESGLVAALLSTEDSVVNRAARTLAAQKPIPPGALPLVLSLVSEGRLLEYREKMFGAAGPTDLAEPLLRSFGAPGARALGDLLLCGSVRARRRATGILAGHAERKVALPALLRGLVDSDALVRRRCMHTIGSIGPDAATATRPLCRVVAGSNPSDSIAACSAFSAIGPRAREAIPLLIRTADGHSRVRFSAARALGNMGSAASIAVPTLGRILARGSTVKDRLTAAESLGRIGTPAATVFLAAALDDPSREVRLQALESLVLLHPGASARFLPQVERLICDSDLSIREQARAAVALISGSAEGVKTALDHLLAGDRGGRQWPWVIGHRLLDAAISGTDETLRATALRAHKRVFPLCVVESVWPAGQPGACEHRALLAPNQ
jgi:HEAT repeat protein